MYKYDQKFFDYIAHGARRSAEQIVPHVKQFFEVKSVLDVGCGAGAWLEVWKRNRAVVTGLDGEYVNRETLLIARDEFISKDLSEPFHLNKKFSLVQSLEVAEHIPECCADQFVSNLCEHSDVILFSAAPPGQGGDNHVNEKPYEYWRKKFAQHNYEALDLIRGAFANNDCVEKWYRYNSFMYVNMDILEVMPAHLQDFVIRGEISDISPTFYKIRKAIIKVIPTSATTKIAKIKENIFLISYRLRNLEK